MKTNPNVIPVLTVLDFHIINVDLEVANMKKAQIVNATLTVQDFHFKNAKENAADGIRNSGSTRRANSNTGSIFGTGRKAVIKFPPIKLFIFIIIKTNHNIIFSQSSKIHLSLLTANNHYNLRFCQKNPFLTWQLAKIGLLVNFIIQKLKSKHLACLIFLW